MATKKGHRGRSGPRRPAAAASGAETEKLERALHLHQQGQLDAAEVIYREILQARPRHARALQLLGVIALQRGQAEQAVELIDQALAIEPSDANAWSNRGSALLRLVRNTEALKSLDRALALNPKHVDALHNRGLALHLLDRSAEALASYDRALKIRPDYPQALNHRGMALCKLGRQLEAMTAFQRALTLQPGVAEYYANMGKALLDLRQAESAESCFRQALKIEKTVAAFEGLSDALYALHRFDESIEICRQWLAFEPDNPIPQHMVAAGSDAAPKRASDQYIAKLFDNFAEGFESTLLSLGYQAPQLLATMVTAELGTDTRPLRILDAGCGTGLAAPLLKPLASQLVGVDLSPKMLAKARGRNLYDELVIGELCAFMASRPATFDLIFLADTLIYFGALEEAFRTAHSALTPGGIFSFAVESRPADSTGTDYRLEPHGRYTHCPDYVTRLLAASGFTLRKIEHVVLRRELNVDVAGITVLARRP